MFFIEKICCHFSRRDCSTASVWVGVGVSVGVRLSVSLFFLSEFLFSMLFLLRLSVDAFFSLELLVDTFFSTLLFPESVPSEPPSLEPTTLENFSNFVSNSPDFFGIILSMLEFFSSFKSMSTV